MQMLKIFGSSRLQGRPRPLPIMNKRRWYKRKKGFFYILVLIQTGVILVMASYVVFLVKDTKNDDIVEKWQNYSWHHELKSKSEKTIREVEARKTFNFVVKGKGKIVESEGVEYIRAERSRPNGKKLYRHYVKNDKFIERNGDDILDSYIRNKNSNKTKKFGKTNRKNNNINWKKTLNKNIKWRDEKRKFSNNNFENENNNNNNDDYDNRNDGRKNPVRQKKSILMFIAILSAPNRIHRRNALRRSWLRQCKEHNTSCYIFTDSLDTYGNPLPDEVIVALEQERFLNKDLILTGSPGGVNFATRYLWIINWANRNYKFDFLLRVDDDYFICMDRLFLELPYRKVIRKLYWGYVHCYPPGGVRVDEGFVIVSNDLIQHFIKEELKSLMCHPYGDQAMMMWINDIENVVYFGDPRVYNEVTADEPIVELFPDICSNFLALHGSYPVQIEQYWRRMVITRWGKYPIPRITYPCGDMDKTFNKTNFEGMYYADPIPCRYSPVWDIGAMYEGRGGETGFN